jgi:hypothetical protein
MPILTAPFSGVVWPSWLLPLRRRGKGGWKGEAVAVAWVPLEPPLVGVLCHLVINMFVVPVHFYFFLRK